MPDAQGKLTAAEQAELADLVLALGHNPKTRRDVAKLVRAHADDPRVKKFVASFSDVSDSPADPKAAPITRGDLDDRLAEDEGRRREAAAKRDREQSRQRLVESGRFTAEAMTGLDRFIADNGYDNLSYDHAATLYAAENPPQTARQTIGSSHAWEMPGTSDPEWRKNPRKKALNEAYKVVDEIRGTRRA